MAIVDYTTDKDPSEVGVYACRVPLHGLETLLEDKFLIWIENAWWHIGSDQRYRGEVIGWVGPLRRKF